MIVGIFQPILMRILSPLLTRRRNAGKKGISSTLGKLGIVDSTSVSVPRAVREWARCSVKESSVKMHLRLLVVSDDDVYPDQMIPTTRNYDDREVAVSLVTDPEVTYLLDRGYAGVDLMNQWLENELLFVVRIHVDHVITVLERREVAKDSFILTDAIVLMGGTKKTKRPVRLVEFRDDQGRLYRLVTTRFDLSAEDVADLYRYRWWIGVSS